MTVSIDIETGIPAGLAGLAQSVVFVRGDARYRRADVQVQLRRFAAPQVVMAREHGKAVGACVLDRRSLHVDGVAATGMYRALLCVAKTHRSRGIGRRLVDAGMAHIDELATSEHEPVYSYGFIDADNRASLHVLKSAGARDAGGIVAGLRYRQWPRRRVELLQSDPQAEQDVTADVDCSWQDRSPSPGTCRWHDPVHDIEARVAVSELRFDTLGRRNDALIDALVKPFPFARRRFDPAAFRYVKLSHVVVSPGRERHWNAWLDSVLAAHDCHYAMLPIDPRRTLARQLGLHDKPASLRMLVRRHGPSAEEAGGKRCTGSGLVGLYPVDV